MTEFKASLIEEGVYKLGKSKINVDTYGPAVINQVSLPEDSEAVEDLEELQEGGMFNGWVDPFYLLPRLFEDFADGEQEEVEGIYSGKRCVCLPDQIVPVHLNSLGWSGNPEDTQDFVVDVKGCGLKLRRAENVSEDDVRKFLMNNELPLRPELQEEMIFSSTDYRGFNTPEGSQTQGSAMEALVSTGFLLGDETPSKIKIAPTLRVVDLPDSIEAVSDELSRISGNADGIVDTVLSEEIRLMPSFVRASYLEHNPQLSAELVRKITSNEPHLRGLTQVFIEDMIPYFEMVAKSTEVEEGGVFKKDKFSWVNVGYTSSIFKDPNNLHKKQQGWYMVKDLVLAQSGMYFVDMECVDVDTAVKSQEEMQLQHSTYFTCLLKDFTRMLALYQMAVEDTRDPRRVSQIVRTTQSQLLDRLNLSDHFNVDTTPNGGLELRVDYTNLGQKNYSIRGDHLPQVGGAE